jgi:predicted GNAT family acetyltransferase
MIVHHKPEACRFEVATDQGLAVLEYRMHGRTAAFVHTEVPVALRGQGLAETLVRAGLGWARSQGFTVDPQCSYVARFIERHPEFADLVVA